MCFISASKLKKLLKIVFNNSKFVLWVEKYLFYPSFFQKLLSYSLLPLTAIYCYIVWRKRKEGLKKKISFSIPIVSIGNLTVGGNGKTPIYIALAKEYENDAIILRRYGHKSHGMNVVSDRRQVICDELASCKEDML